MDALKLLTLDCWREVLDRVKNPEDLKACSETCSIFEGLLMRKMNVFLFDLILPLIYDYLPIEDIEPEEEASLKPLYDCRAVCKDWCKSIDKFTETTSHGPPFDYWFTNGDTTERFLITFATHVGNPFIGRCVTIVHRSTLLMASPQENDQNEDAPHDEILHITKIRQLLNRFGKEIYFLELFENNAHQHLALCLNIPMVLSHLPNLRQLVVNPFFMTFEEENMDELPAYIAANPLPSLPHLEDLDVPGLNLVMTRSMLEKYSPQLTCFTTCWGPSQFLEELPRFNCLEKLYFDCLDASVSLQGLRQLRFLLRMLRLEIKHNRQQLSLWPIDELFRNIQHLPIRELRILNFSDVFLGESAQISPEQRVRHESISEVKINCARGTVSLNFLASCSKLEEFVMTRSARGPNRLPSRHPNGVAEMFDVTRLIKEDRYDLYKSNVWETIPNLKKFSLNDFEEENWRCTHYHRKTYEEKKRENSENKKDSGSS